MPAAMFLKIHYYVVASCRADERDVAIQTAFLRTSFVVELCIHLWRMVKHASSGNDWMFMAPRPTTPVGNVQAPRAQTAARHPHAPHRSQISAQQAARAGAAGQRRRVSHRVRPLPRRAARHEPAGHAEPAGPAPRRRRAAPRPPGGRAGKARARLGGRGEDIESVARPP